MHRPADSNNDLCLVPTKDTISNYGPLDSPEFRRNTPSIQVKAAFYQSRYGLASNTRQDVNRTLVRSTKGTAIEVSAQVERAAGPSRRAIPHASLDSVGDHVVSQIHNQSAIAESPPVRGL